MSKISFKQEKTLELLEKNTTALKQTIRNLDKKAQDNIRASSIIVGIVGALNLNNESIFAVNNEMLFIFILYFITLILCFIVVTPKEQAGYPLETSWEEVQRVLQKDRGNYYDWVVASYITAYSKNKEIMNKKSFLVKLSNLSLAINVGFIILVAIVR